MDALSYSTCGEMKLSCLSLSSWLKLLATAIITVATESILAVRTYALWGRPRWVSRNESFHISHSELKESLRSYWHLSPYVFWWKRHFWPG